MPTNSDSGYASSVSNFEELLTALTYLGPAYNPGPASLKLPALQAQLAAMKALLNDVSNSESALDVAITLRAQSFGLLPERATRVSNMLKVYSPASPVMASVAGHVRKLRGKRATDPPLNPDGTPAPTNSSAQTTYSSKVSILTDLINDLEGDPLYVPTDATLTTAGLGTFRDDLSSRNSGFNNARIPLMNARAARNTALNDEAIGLRVVAQQVKAYVKATFGVKSPQYAQIKGLRI